MGRLGKAQESTNASGGDATGSGGTVAYSVGEIVYTTNAGSLGSAAQGVQHAYEIFTMGIEETALHISLTAFPNPTTDNLTLQISEYNSEKLAYKLYDLHGKMLKGESNCRANEHKHIKFATCNLLHRSYNRRKQKVQSFKVIKN